MGDGDAREDALALEFCCLRTRRTRVFLQRKSWVINQLAGFATT